MTIRSSIAAVLLAAGATSSFAVAVVPTGFTTYVANGGFKYTSPTVIAPLGFGRLDGFGRADSAAPGAASKLLGSTSGLATTLADPGYTPGISPPNYLDNWTFDGLKAGTYEFKTQINTYGLLAIDTVLLGWYSGGTAHFQSITVGSDFKSATGITTITVDPGCEVNSCVWLNIYGWEDKTSSPRGYTASISQVPEPQTYALLLAGLGVIGFVARRRTLAPVSTRHALKVL